MWTVSLVAVACTPDAVRTTLVPPVSVDTATLQYVTMLTRTTFRYLLSVPIELDSSAMTTTLVPFRLTCPYFLDYVERVCRYVPDAYLAELSLSGNAMALPQFVAAVELQCNRQWYLDRLTLVVDSCDGTHPEKHIVVSLQRPHTVDP